MSDDGGFSGTARRGGGHAEMARGGRERGVSGNGGMRGQARGDGTVTAAFGGQAAREQNGTRAGTTARGDGG